MANTYLPGFQPFRLFETWRFNPNDKTLIYVFDDTIETEQAAISTIIEQQYDKQSIVCARQLKSKWFRRSQQHQEQKQREVSYQMAIEAVFATDCARANAIRTPIFYNGKELYPVTTCQRYNVLTVLSLINMKLLSSRQELDAEFRSTAKDILKKFYYYTISEDQIVNLALHKTDLGIYDGSGTMVVRDVNIGTQTLTVKADYNGYLVPIDYDTNTLDYPPITANFRTCYLYCDNCLTVNDHNTPDCRHHPQHYEQHPNLSTEKKEEENRETQPFPRNENIVGVGRGVIDSVDDK